MENIRNIVGIDSVHDGFIHNYVCLTLWNFYRFLTVYNPWRINVKQSVANHIYTGNLFVLFTRIHSRKMCPLAILNLSKFWLIMTRNQTLNHNIMALSESFNCLHSLIAIFPYSYLTKLDRCLHVHKFKYKFDWRKEIPGRSWDTVMMTKYVIGVWFLNVWLCISPVLCSFLQMNLPGIPKRLQ